MLVRVVTLALALAAPGAVRAGDVRGSVRLLAAAPKLEALRVTKDQPTCGASLPDESLVVKDGRLANVVVYLRAIPGVRPEPRKVVLDQRGCRFTPRVLTAPVGSTLELANGDPILHGVHGWAGKLTAFDVPMPEEGERVTKPLANPGLVIVGCDVHAWMRAYVWVADGPAAVTGEDGAFVLSGVPAGAYTLTAWHERLGEQTVEVTVPASGDARVDVAWR